MLADGLIEVLDEVGHLGAGNSFPSLFYNNHLPYTIKTTIFVDKGFHYNNGYDGKQSLIVFDTVYLKDDKRLVEQVDVFFLELRRKSILSL